MRNSFNIARNFRLKVLTGFCPQLAFGLRWYHGVIPKAVDDYHRDMDDFRNQDSAGRLNNPVWHIHGGGPPKSNMILTYSVLLSIASVASASDTDVIWGYICSYEPSVTPETNPDLAAYQFPTLDSETIPYALMVRFCCICGAKIVHATRNPRIPRSGCRFDLRNPAFQARTRRRSDLAEPLIARWQAAKRRNAESSVSC